MRRTAIAFVISSIFAAGDVGAVYEPWDLSTLFKDSTGTIPATVNNEVGLMLDKSKGLEKSLWNSFDFSSSTNWVLGTGWSIDTGIGILSASGAPNASVAYYSTTQYPIGVRLEITFTISGLTAGGVYLAIDNGGGNGTIKTANGTYTETITHAAGSGLLRFITNGASVTLNIDNVTVNVVEGNHAFQTVTASKPILRQDANGFYYLEHDGLDDQMTTGNVFTIQNDSFMAMAYAYNAASGSSGVPVFGLHKDSLNYLYLAQRPATAHIHSASVRAGNFGLAPVNVIAPTNSTAPNAPLVTHTRLINNKIYTGKNNVELAPADFLIEANTITGSPLKINGGLALDLRFYGGLYRQKDLTVTDRANVISYFAQHAGA